MPPDHSVIVDLAPYCNNAGISSCCDPAADGLDGMGTIFWAESLPASGTTIAYNGTRFVFPDKSDGMPDNVACEGQDIPLPVRHYRALHVLGMCDWRAFEEFIQLRAPDGTCTETRLGLSDASHYQGLQYGEHEALTCSLFTPDSLIPHVFLFGISLPGADYEMTETHLEAGIWHQVIALETSRPLAGLVLPDNPSMHLFALTVEASI
ncbi:MAG: hypothetical protein F4Z30_17355 [Gemmatimonadetes bacterium]|nr:hypothetical protein [Gemmatimonadota bacterium]